MFCPQCGSTQPDELNYCKSCGAHLNAVRTALDAGTAGPGERFDWSKTWVAEMLMSGEESLRRAAEIERLQGKTPEVKRRNEIKAGVITASTGVGLTIVLAIIMEGIIASGAVPPAAIAILSRVWIVGLIPIFIGAALIINGVFVSKKDGEKSLTHPDDERPENTLRPAATNELGPAVPFSVTDNTTRHLEDPILRNTAKNKQ
ncbi:MAG TPA: hypothetical protein VHQ01_01085 [Pyrinomonadaceae bacterium]|nr:hypothetical protein [Pyrinomonadaceae bacterium]